MFGEIFKNLFPIGGSVIQLMNTYKQKLFMLKIPTENSTTLMLVY